MPYAIELYFDSQAETAVRHIWQAIADAGSSSPMLEAGHRPHVSLAVYDSEDLDTAESGQALASFARLLAPFPLLLSHIGIFATAEGVLYLGATATEDLLALHARFHDVFADYAHHLRPYYRVGRWVPHCTLAHELSAAACADLLPLCWSAPLPLQVTVQEIGISRVSPTSCDFTFVYPLERP
jgi:2'-5' RNA ligase